MRLIDADALIMALRLEYPMIPMFKENQKEWEIKTEGYRKAEEVIKDAPTIEPKRGKNLNNEYADCDQFICSECGIELRDWTRVETDEDDGEEYHYEYVFRFRPNCGVRMKGADDE